MSWGRNIFRERFCWPVSLPATNEVWSKVVFSQVFVCQQEGVGFTVCITGHMREGSASRWVCLQGGLHPGGSASRGVCLQGVCLQGSASKEGSAIRWVRPPTRDTCDTTRYSQQAGGTHPTGMFSCLWFKHKRASYLSLVWPYDNHSLEKAFCILLQPLTLLFLFVVIGDLLSLTSWY